MDKPLNKYFDHTLLKPEATHEDIINLCKEAKEYDFYSVCVNSMYVPLAKEELKGTEVKVASVVGFPLGAMATEPKAFETEWAVNNGADEIDMVLPIGLLKEGNYEETGRDIEEVKKAARNAVLKVILETCLLTEEEILKACAIAVENGADFVKTSTGFSTKGADIDTVKLMKNAVEGKAKVKASGGIRDLDTAMAMIEAGADRLGASSTVNIMKELENR